MFDELSLRKSSGQGDNNVNMIRHAAHVNEIGAEVAADCCKIRMHAPAHIESSQGSRFFVLKMM